MGVFSTLARLLGTHPAPLDGATSQRDLERRLAALETHIKALYDETAQLRKEETQRAAEHAAMVDQLTRLYKRVSARIARSEEPQNGESPLALKRRLGR